jgi:hypothetical protein
MFPVELLLVFPDTLEQSFWFVVCLLGFFVLSSTFYLENLEVSMPK